jgi:hypothetical protein
MRKNKVFTPPHDYDNSRYTIDGVFPLNLFLAGTIDNGDSLEWGKALIGELDSCDTVRPIMIYNPRRDEWNANASKDEMDKQINWELYHLERADLIVMNILPNSKSPISLLELGLFARQSKMIVFCNENFYRYDNVRVVCESYGVPLYNTNDVLVIKNKVLEYANKL